MIDTTKSGRVWSHAVGAFAAGDASNTEIDTDTDIDTRTDVDAATETDDLRMETDIDAAAETEIDAATETEIDAATDTELDGNSSLTIASTGCDDDATMDTTIAAIVLDDAAGEYQAARERASTAKRCGIDHTEAARSW